MLPHGETVCNRASRVASGKPHGETVCNRASRVASGKPLRRGAESSKHRTGETRLSGACSNGDTFEAVHAASETVTFWCVKQSGRELQRVSAQASLQQVSARAPLQRVPAQAPLQTEMNDKHSWPPPPDVLQQRPTLQARLRG